MSADAFSTQRPRFSLRAVSLQIAVAAVILGIGGNYFFLKRTEARANNVRHHLSGISVGIDVYEDDNGYVPNGDMTDPAGKVLSSWRFRLMDYMEDGIRHDWRAAWDAPANQRIAKGTAGSFGWNAGAPGDTSVFGITGPDTVFDGTRRKRVDLPPHLILLVEVRDSKIHWMQPGDYNVADLLAYRGKIGDHLHGLLDDRLLVLFADGEVWALSPDAPMTALHSFLTITGAESHNRNQLLAPHRVE
jgi:hypothetical protein